MNEKKLLEFIHFLLESNFATPMKVECKKSEDEETYSAEIKNPKHESMFGVHLPVNGKQEKDLKPKALLQLTALLIDHILNNKL